VISRAAFCVSPDNAIFQAKVVSDMIGQGMILAQTSLVRLLHGRCQPYCSQYNHHYFVHLLNVITIYLRSSHSIIPFIINNGQNTNHNPHSLLHHSPHSLCLPSFLPRSIVPTRLQRHQTKQNIRQTFPGSNDWSLRWYQRSCQMSFSYKQDDFWCA